MTILQFAEEIVRLTRTASRIEYRELPEDDPKQRQPNIAKAKAVLGWEPRVPLEDGLRKTVEYFQPIVSAAASS